MTEPGKYPKSASYMPLKQHDIKLPILFLSTVRRTGIFLERVDCGRGEWGGLHFIGCL